jgi:hypothetical protein
MSIRSILFIFLFLFSSNTLSLEKSKKYLHVEDNYKYDDPWVSMRGNEKQSLRALVKLLKRSRTGRRLLENAERKAGKSNKGLYDIIAVGDGSLTDTTLIRKFSPSHPEEVFYESHSKVFLNKGLNVLDAVLDMAHELTHFTYRTAFNPYRQNFTLKEFVTSTVEGRGGEVDAYMVECKVLYELFPRHARSKSNCQKVMNDDTGRFSKVMGIEQFYRVGRQLGRFERDMRRYNLTQGDLPHLSNSTALFISSAYGLPYPVAAMKEYVSIMGRACKNDQKRLALLEQRNGRSPASATKKGLKRLRKSYRKRCSKFPSSS